MNHAIIATWDMALDGVKKAWKRVPDAQPEELIATAIHEVENNPAFVSVGYGGLPNRDGIVELDAAYMNGSNFQYGGIISTRNIESPIDVAIHLSCHRLNCLLSGTGAENYAQLHHFPSRNMLTEASFRRWKKERDTDSPGDDFYRGHDTVCVIAKQGDDMSVGVSTSGLYMKTPGRVGDSPIIGSGFYCESGVGGAAATGIGEDIMRGCLSFMVVNLMERGVRVQEACECALSRHVEKMARTGKTLENISLIAMDAQGQGGAATILPEFPFVYAAEGEEPAVYTARNIDGKTIVDKGL